MAERPDQVSGGTIDGAKVAETNDADDPSFQLNKIEEDNPNALVQKKAFTPSYLLDEDLRSLSRTVEVFEKIEQQPHMSFSLPRPGATAGAVLGHATKAFERLHKKEFPMTFKFGITHCAHFRWHHHPYGYKYDREKFDRMLIIYATSNPAGPAFLEASLIEIFGSCLAIQSKNQRH